MSRWYNFLGLFQDNNTRAAALPQPRQGLGFGTFLPSSDIDAAPIKSDKESLENYLGWVYIAVSTISEDVRALEYTLKRESDKEDIEVPEHDFLRVLRKPNENTNYADFIEVTVASYLLTGHFFWQIITDERDNAVGIQFIPPHYVDEPIFADGIHTAWRVTVPGYAPRNIPIEDVIRVKKPHPLDPFDAASPLEAMAVSHYFDQYLRAYGTSLLKNDGGVPAGLLNSDLELTQEQAEDIRERWVKKRRNRRDDVAVLGKGTKYQQLAVPLEDINFLEIGDFGMDQVLGAYKVPRAVIGVSREFNRANMDGAFRFYQQQALAPIAKLIAKTINEQVKPRFLNARENRVLYFELENPVDADRELERAEALEKLNSGAYQVNEYRQALGDDPVPDGNVYLVPTKVKVMASLKPEQIKEKQVETKLSVKLANLAMKKLASPSSEVKQLNEQIQALTSVMHSEFKTLRGERDALALKHDSEKMYKRLRAFFASEQLRHKREGLEEMRLSDSEFNLKGFALRQEGETLLESFEALKGQRGKEIALQLVKVKHVS